MIRLAYPTRDNAKRFVITAHEFSETFSFKTIRKIGTINEKNGNYINDSVKINIRKQQHQLRPESRYVNDLDIGNFSGSTIFKSVPTRRHLNKVIEF